MPPAGLIDTSAIVAIVDREDRWHAPCLEALRSVHIPLLTTEAVLTETFHLAGRTTHDKERIWRFVLSGALEVYPTTHAEMPTLSSLMLQYADRPMDFADATLVHLATRKSLSLILTLDHNDFETYRIGGRKQFTILPMRRL